MMNSGKKSKRGVFHRHGKGKKNAAAQPTTGEAIQKLRDTEEMLEKKQQFLETKIEKEIAMARRNAKTNKSVAMAALKRKKRLETQLQQIDGTLTTLETQRITLESANTNTAVLTTMGDAARAMRRAHADMDVEKVHDLMDDISEQQQVASEIADAISNPVAFGQDYDEDDLEAELGDLEAEVEAQEQAQLDQDLLSIGPMPNVPNTKLPPAAVAPAKNDEDEMIKQLAAWAT